MTIDNSYDFILQEAHKCKTCSIQEMNLIGILLDGLNLQGEKCFNPIRNFSWNYKSIITSFHLDCILTTTWMY